MSTLRSSKFLVKGLEQVIASKEKIPSLNSLLNELIESQSNLLGMDQAQTKACQELVEASIQKDKVTQLDDGFHDPFMVHVANLYSKAKDKESHFIEGDFSNLFNCNNAIGKSLTNKMMNIIIDIYKQKFNDISPELIYGSRSGGDEFRFIVVGVSEQKLHQAIEAVQNEIEKFVEDLGLDQLEHSKYPGDPIKKGVGAEVATKKLPVSFPSYELTNELDQDINEKKRRSGERRMLKDSEKKTTIELSQHISQSPERIKKIEVAIGLRDAANKNDTLTQNKDFPFKDFASECKSGNLYKRKNHGTLKRAKTLKMNKQQSEFLSILLTEIYDSKDERTNMRRNRDFLNVVEEMQASAKQQNSSCFLIKMEAYNFSSLNEIFSHYGNDMLFQQLADITSKHLKGLDAELFHRGGGIIATIISEKNPDEINQAINHIIEEFHQTIGNKSIKEYFIENQIPYIKETLEKSLQKLGITEDTKIKDIPHIRGFKPGSGFIIAKVDLRKSADSIAALTELDKLTEQNKILGITFKTEERIIYLDGTKANISSQQTANKMSRSTSQIFQQLGINQSTSLSKELSEKPKETRLPESDTAVSAPTNSSLVEKDKSIVEQTSTKPRI